MINEITIGWKKFEIDIREANNKILIANGQECYGHIEYEESKIYLNKNNNSEQQKATLIHEVLHGISDMYSLDMSEDLVTRLGNAIYTTLKQNDLEIK